MTGAGAITFAYALEESFMTLPADPTWRLPGQNVEPGERSFQNQLSRVNKPDTPRPQGSREGNKRGEIPVSFDLTDDNFHELVFPVTETVDSTAENVELPDSAQEVPTATIYLAADTVDVDQDLFLQGAPVLDATWNYQQGEAVSVDLTFGYANEVDSDDTDAPAIPSTISEPSYSDIVNFHDVDWTIDGVSVPKLQSLQLSLSGLSRFQYGQSREPLAAVTARQEPSLTAEAILEDETQRELAYGSSGSSSPQSTIGKTDTTLSFNSHPDLSIQGVQPETHSWSQLAGQEDVTDPTEYHVETVVVDHGQVA